MSVSPTQLQNAAFRGVDRLRNFRSARLMFIRNYTGPNYDREKGTLGQESLNLIFNAVRTLVPNIVMTHPKHTVRSRFLASREYADLLGLALSDHDRKIDISSIYRRVMVDAIFMLGILKTGLAESDSVMAVDETNRVDTGTIYTECTDFDNLVVDPECTEHLFRDARFIGDKVCVPRERLLQSGLYKNDLIERLPSVDYTSGEPSVANISRSGRMSDDYLEEEVEIVELWVPQAKALVTIPGNKNTRFDDYIRVDDYYGPNEGPYTFLALTPPVPGNPLPVSMVGVWNDLHIQANRMAFKIMDQAERQKDVITYKPQSADDVVELRDAGDGDTIAVENPEDINVVSFGGQRQSNEGHLAQLQNWFNMMAANPQGIGGQDLKASSATEANILQNNASIGLEDMKDMVYRMGASEARKRAWYLHSDPFIQLPLIRRKQVPPTYEQSSMSGIPLMATPPSIQEEQVVLTPEARSGDFLDFTFEFIPESMGRMDSKKQLEVAMDFAVRVVPAAATTAQAFAMMGIPFSVKAYILRMAKLAGIEWFDEVFYDPEFQLAMATMMQMGPDPSLSKGQAAGATPPNMAALLQNGQPGGVMGQMPGQQEAARAGMQEGANQGQSDLKSMY